MTKNEIADVLTEIGTLLELKGENPFKVRAYQTGARVIEGLDQAELLRLVKAGSLDSIKGIGEALAEKVTELVATGRLEFFDKLKASIAVGLVEMLQIPGLGPKKIQTLNKKLGIDSIKALEKACLDGRVAALDGFGSKTQDKLIAGIKNREAYGRRYLWWDAWNISAPILAGLRSLPSVIRVESAGSLRRGMDTVGDLDFLVSSKDTKPVIKWFTELADVAEVTANGSTKVSLRFKSGLQADLRLVPDDQFPFALHHFTGSKEHNVEMRQRALSKGLSLSEWGLVPSEAAKKTTTETFASKTKVESESDIFRCLDLAYIPPELREGLGEIEAAEKGTLPHLVELGDIKGCFHNHTTESDGQNTLLEMAAAADALRWEYLGIADHSKSSYQANGLSEKRLEAQIKQIDSINRSGQFKVHIFAGSEVDILPNGNLDFTNGLLDQLDYVVASVHSAFSQSSVEMTARILTAVNNPRVTFIGHVTGRLLLRREPYAFDLDEVVRQSIRSGCLLELNANPSRLDLDWRSLRKHVKDIKTVINPDAHTVDGLRHVAAGINIARKGGLTRSEVLNTQTLVQTLKYFDERKRKHA